MTQPKKQVTLKKSRSLPPGGPSTASVSAIPTWCAYDEMLPINGFKPNPRNPNRHNPEQLRVYAKIIRGNGWRRPVVVSRRSGLIVKGHGAVEACRQHGITEAPVNYQDYASAEAELQDMLADNELARLATNDEPALQELLADLEESGCDQELTGILKTLGADEPIMKTVEVVPPPKMAWVLIGIPLVQFSEINQHVEAIARNPEALVESTVSNDTQEDADDQKNG